MSAAQQTASRDSGLDAARHFLADDVRRYAKLRNFDFGPERRSNVSVLSPYIRHRLILESEVVAATVQTHGLDATAKYVEEVFWRAYFKGWMEHRPSIWSQYNTDLRNLLQHIEQERDLLDRYTTAVEGNTGIDCFDAWTRELVETGYLHNHARMWFASIWVFTLRLPWQLGADFFLRHLVDGDPASNTLSWRWVCGLHTRGKTYLARVSNIVNYTDNRFNPRGLLSTSATPLSEDREHTQHPLALNNEPLPTGRYGLLVTEEDCSPESLDGLLNPASIIGGLAIRRRSPLPVGTPAHAFAKQALEDAVSRAAGAFSVDGETFEADSWTQHLVEWCQARDIDTLVTAYVPRGPVRDVLDESLPQLDAAGIRLQLHLRDYDREAWPYASRGYFKLKKRIPEIIESLSLDSIPTDAAPADLFNTAPELKFASFSG